jgi:hypothetical protein
MTTWNNCWESLPDVVWIDSLEGPFWVNQLVLVIFDNDGDMQISLAEYDRTDPQGAKWKSTGLNEKGEWVERELKTVTFWSKIPPLP